PTQQVHRWYRVASTDGDPIVDTSNADHPTWQRRVYLDGADWRFWDNATPPNPIPTYATIVEGVVSVTERVDQIRRLCATQLKQLKRFNCSPMSHHLNGSARLIEMNTMKRAFANQHSICRTATSGPRLPSRLQRASRD